MIDKEFQIICSGFGGQGILTLGLILSNIAMETGAEITWIPAYGSEMRGGTASCSVKISNKSIASPFIRNGDILIAMNEPSVDKFESTLQAGGMILINSSIIGERGYRDDISVYTLDANRLAADLGNTKGAGIAMIGALIKCTGLFDQNETMMAIDCFFNKKGKNNPLNKACFEQGYECVKRIAPRWEKGGCF